MYQVGAYRRVLNDQCTWWFIARLRLAPSSKVLAQNFWSCITHRVGQRGEIVAQLGYGCNTRKPENFAHLRLFSQVLGRGTGKRVDE